MLARYAGDGVIGVGGESARALAAFRAYCALGPRRSLAKLAEAGQSSLRYLELWSAKYGWVRRAAEYDAEHEAALEAERVRREADAEEARREMLARHAQEAKDLFVLAVRRLEYLAEAGGLDASSAVRLVQVAVQVERLARGVSQTQRVQVGVGMVTLDQLAQVERDGDEEQAEWERQRGYDAKWGGGIALGGGGAGGAGGGAEGDATSAGPAGGDGE